MKALLARLKARHWDVLGATEQKTVIRGAWILLPLLMYGLLWQPAHQALPKLQTALPQLRAQAAQMQSLAGQVQSLRQQAQPAVLDSDALKIAVEKAASEANLPLQIVPGEPNSVRISADSIAFAQWLQWQRSLEQTHHIRVSSAMLVATTETGMVKVQATLTNGADQ
ncbi:type II secretion system protein GspM [Sideroxydans lithotrophicus]|uniref:General secretion pathway M protein n=1 Tax=Sideroxydans lithotrophicus (strain ES-1) TaxID=580332 RepID=D5CMB6_SIDLE|nr:type II secretion system protein GspM [Sideroxydans lithotrophicus]ADE10730.1 General secretion pathway M protein [Sideroxydans lithotrophicus ES-1]